MRLSGMTLGFGLFVLSCALADSGTEQARDREYIQHAESDWVQSVVTCDANVLDRILANDFVGVDIDGSHYSKTDAMQMYCPKTSKFASVSVTEFGVHFYGDTAVVQGAESWKKKDSSSGRFVWTDVWIHRDGSWQMIAAEDLVPAEGTPIWRRI
jgi:ketosteroid isomerase-like protein